MFELYFDDLKPEAQKRFLAAAASRAPLRAITMFSR